MITEATDRIYRQTERGSQLLQDNYIVKLGRFDEGPEVAHVFNGTFQPALSGTYETTAYFLTSCKRVDGK